MRSLFPRLAIPALLLTASLSSAGDPTPVEQALAAFKEGDYGKAINLAIEVPKEDADYAKARYLLGEALLVTGSAPDAEKAFRDGLEKKAESVPLLTGLGRALTAQGTHEEAMRTLQHAAKLDPKDAGARRAIGEALAAQGKPLEARRELDAAVKLDPKDPLTARAVVEVAMKQEDWAGARTAAERLAQADPKAPMGPFLRGLVLDRTGKDKEAIEAYEAAIALDPKFVDAHKNLAILCVTKNTLYQDKERTKKAMEHFEKYFELGGKDEELQKTYQTMKSFLEGPKEK